MMTRIAKLGVALAMVIGATTGCGIVGGGSTEITAVFKDTAGLFLGNDVGVLGVRVGKVTKIEPQGEGVTFGLNDSVYLMSEGGGKKQPGAFARLSCTLAP